ncbi:MAG: SPASM domain-containing protein [Patescibacteria group bacterium]|jgi:hypothetical protein|nr:SPASM domain-containing protein [Patescibacteria group bacterium]
MKIEKPKAIEIQTTSYCNAGCIICPHSRVSKTQKMGIMSFDLFKKIIDESRNLGIKRVVPYFNNEPFLDPHFFKRLDYINKTDPEFEIEISSNLSMLNKINQEKLSNFIIKELRISIFGFSKISYEKVMPNLKWNRTYENLKMLVKNKKLRKNIENISIVMVDFPDSKTEEKNKCRDFCKKHNINFNFWGFLDRAGSVKEFSNNVIKNEIFGCEQNRPNERIHVLFNGDVVLCCMDWEISHKIGNLERSSVLNVWESSLYQKYREAIYNNGNQKYLSLCKKCKLAL